MQLINHHDVRQCISSFSPLAQAKTIRAQWMEPLLSLIGVSCLANERLFGDYVVDLEKIGQFHFRADRAMGQH